MVTRKGKYLKFNFDISSYRLLGRELITDRITALFEIVKNGYDANAENVKIYFYSVQEKSPNSRIIISDDGTGMTLDDLENKWMVIGTMSKREKRRSPAPYYRTLVGKKGVGRFAVDKLGSKIVLKTSIEGSTVLHCLETDWGNYEKIENNQLTLDFNRSEFKYFTDIENRYWEEKIDSDYHGTTLEIVNVNDPWTKRDIQKADTELSKLVSPILTHSFPFNIFISSDEYSEDYDNKVVENNAIGFATVETNIEYSLGKQVQEQLRFNNSTKSIDKVETPFLKMGPIKMKMYYFDQKDKQRFRKNFAGAPIDGVKIYRDGIIATPFAEYALERDKERDILGIDKRRYSDFFDKVSSRDLLGFVEITDEYNPKILEATNRQDFVDNEEYRTLREFIISQINELEKFLTSKKEEEREFTKSRLKVAREDLQATSDIIRSIKKIASPQVKTEISKVERNVRDIQVQIKRGISDYNELEKEKKRQQNLYLSLMSLQDYAAEISHVVRTSISNIEDSSQFFTKFYPNPQYENDFLEHAAHIEAEMSKLSQAVDFMLSYAKSNIGFSEIDLRATISKLFNKTYKQRFIQEGIHTTVELRDTIVFNHNVKFFEDIFENLIGNSIKALKDKEGSKFIKCSGGLNESYYEILFSDNGYGIPKKIQSKVFNIYFTTTAEEGGAGMGLYIVKTRINAMKGSIEIDEPEFDPKGTTFKIRLPLKNENDEKEI